MEEREKKTPIFNWETGEFMTDLSGRIVTVTEEDAVKQIILKAQQTIRGAFLIYADADEPENDHTYGNEAQDILTTRDLSDEVRISELERAIKESLEYDPWIEEVYEIQIQRMGTDEAEVSFWVRTIFDTEIEVEGVDFNNE